MDPVTGLNLGRIAVGALALGAPATFAQALQVDAPGNPQLPYVGRLFGVREVALGLATVAARGPARRNLVLLGIAVDLGDVATAQVSLREGTIGTRTANAMLVPAGGAALAGVVGLLAGWRATRAARRAAPVVVTPRQA